MKNLFDYATKELSQDAFLRWLFENYNCENQEVVRVCKKIFNAFTKNELDFSKLEKLTTTAQWNKIDIAIWFKCDGKEYLIVVEDKTTSEEREQLEKYSKKLDKYCDMLVKKGNPIQKVYKVFYKTSKISGEEKERIEEAEWENVLGIEEIYNIFKDVEKTGSEVLDYYVERIKTLNKLWFNYNEFHINEWCKNFTIFTNYCDDIIKNYPNDHYRSRVYQGKYAETFIQKNLPNNITVELGMFFRGWGCSAWIKVWNSDLGWKEPCQQIEEIKKLSTDNFKLIWENKQIKNRIKIVKKNFTETLDFKEFDLWIKNCIEDYLAFSKKVAIIPNLV